eukprot:CAMPEP_0202690168 /NCGR_PEP_ID=MMETSP1385-20130828/5249_1 /ASSEMBLY_ACC=CAM_ASM_000861 /TAXON_ID=933848 /ORGANISM="Elphidium margaritaceum" /LENGTH=317 /DNA_ID=CAMNT_0049345403 /DNA_START=58 /DNA_END=1008 /DNA_ORIENTATION=-
MFVLSAGCVVSSILLVRLLLHRYRPTSSTSLREQTAQNASNGHHADNEDPLTLYARIKANNDKLSLDAIHFIQRTIDQYKLPHLAFSFNGGKDCVVLLYLIRIALQLLNERDEHLPIIWFQRNKEFKELEEFLRFCVKRFKFPLFETSNDYKNGLEHYLKNGNPQCRAVFLGQRRNDPWCGDLQLSTHCTSGWPDIMRINPILEWSHNDVWNFLLRYNLHYCCLYEHGYTSLGATDATIPNPLLYDRHLVKFNAAHKLTHYQNAERFGRLITPKIREQKADLIEDRVKVLIVAHSSQIDDNILKNVKMGIETSFVDG